MLRSAGIATARVALRLVAASSRPPILHCAMANADPTVRSELLLSLNSVPRLPLDFSRSYARERKLSYEEEFDEDEDMDNEDSEELEGLDDDDFDEDDDDFDDDDDDDGETRD